MLVNLFNRKIIGHTVGLHTDANLILKPSGSIQVNLNQIRIFHTDGEIEFADYVNEYNNHRIPSLLGYLTSVQYQGNSFKKSCLV